MKGRWAHNGNMVPQIPEGIKTCSDQGKSKPNEKKRSSHLDANISGCHCTPPLNSVSQTVLLSLYQQMPVSALIMFSLMHMLWKSWGIFTFNQQNFISTARWTEIISIAPIWPFHRSLPECTREAGRRAQAHPQKPEIMPEINSCPRHPDSFSYGKYFIHFKHWILICNIHRAMHSVVAQVMNI